MHRPRLALVVALAASLAATTGAAAQGADSVRRPAPQPRRMMMRPFFTEDAVLPGEGPWGGPMRGGPGGPGGLGRPGRRALLRGITLSADQEKALRSARARRLLEGRPLMLEVVAARTDAQVARLNGDQKGLDAATARLEAARARADSLRAKGSPLTELRAVLTPDQQQRLDRNLAEGAREGRAGAMGPGMRHRMRRGGPGGMGGRWMREPGMMGPGGMSPWGAPRMGPGAPRPPRPPRPESDDVRPDREGDRSGADPR